MDTVFLLPMKSVMPLPIIALAAFAITLSMTHAADNMKAFPPAAAGMVRFVLPLAPEKDEDSPKVELVVGKTVKLDAGNRYFFGGSMETVTIEGWGFDYHILRKLGPMAGTLMAVDPDAPKVERFIAVGGEPQLLRYNSRLPLVIYVPEGVQVRYRIWRAGADLKKAEQG